MLSKEDNETLCRVGPGTPMGELIREYWFPAIPSFELPEPDCPPKKIRLLGDALLRRRAWAVSGRSPWRRTGRSASPATGVRRRR